MIGPEFSAALGEELVVHALGFETLVDRFDMLPNPAHQRHRSHLGLEGRSLQVLRRDGKFQPGIRPIPEVAFLAENDAGRALDVILDIHC